MTKEAAKEFIEEWCFARGVACRVEFRDKESSLGESVEVVMRRMVGEERFQIGGVFSSLELERARGPEGYIRLLLTDMVEKLNRATADPR